MVKLGPLAALPLALCASFVQAQVRKPIIIPRVIVPRAAPAAPPTQGPGPRPVVKTSMSQTAKVALGVAPEVPPMTLRVATGTSGGRPEARLRWIMNEGWIPDGQGFNVYKIVGGVRTGPLNRALLVPNSQKFAAPKGLALHLSASQPNILMEAFQAASVSPPNVDRKLLFQFTKLSAAPPLAAGPTFKQLKSEIAQYTGARPQALLPIRQALQRGLDSPAVAPYAAKLGLTSMTRARVMQTNLQNAHMPGARQMSVVSKVVSIGGAANAAPTPMTQRRLALPGSSSGTPGNQVLMATNGVESIRRARTLLAIGALTTPSVADGLGLSFTDSQVQSGQSVEYVLSFVRTNGQSLDLATADLTVGADPQPAPPDGLDAMQIGVNAVALYWNSPTEAVQQQFMLPSYRVVRIDAQHPQGLDVAGKPILKSTQLATDSSGMMVEPIFTSQDHEAPVGPVTYKVTMLDAFGRESATAATVSLTVADWATPQPVDKVKLQMTNDKLPQVLWTASADAPCKYRVYRVDPALLASQGPAYVPTLVSSDMIDGTPALAQGEGAPLRGLLAMQGSTILKPNLQRPGSMNERAISARAGLQQYLSFTDSGAPRDKFYRYIVTAAYARNGRDSEPRISEVVGVPLLTGPATPSGLSGSFSVINKYTRVPRNFGRLFALPVSSIRTAATAPVALRQLPAPPAPISSGGRSLKMVSTMSRLGAIAKLPTPVYGGEAILTWQALSGAGAPFSYRLYRIPDSPTPSPTARSIRAVQLSPTAKMLSVMMAPAPAKAPSVSATSHLAQVQLRPAGPSSSRIASMASLKARDFATRLSLTAPPTLVGETSGSSLSDGFLPSAVGQDVDYIVIPKNQWGLEGDPARTRVHIKPSMAPSVPTLVSATANPAQPDQALLSVTANPADEEVTQYIVLRKTLPQPVKARSRFARRLSLVPLTRMSPKVGLPTVSQSQPMAKMAMQVGGLSLVEMLDYLPVPDSSITVVPDGGLVNLIDSSTQANMYYAYRVVAVNSSGLKSGQSGYLEAGTRLASLPKPTLGDLTQSADGVTLPVTGAGAYLLVVERAQTINGVDTDFIQIMGPVSGALIDRTVLAGHAYKYQVRAFDPATGLSSPPSNVASISYQP